MTSAKLDAAATVTWPSVNDAADTTHEKGVIFRVDNVATSTPIGSTSSPIPKNCRGRYWRMLTTEANVDFGWLLEGPTADTAPTLVQAQDSTMGTGAAAAAPTLVANIPEQIYCPPTAYALVFISSAANGKFSASVAGPKTAPVK